MDHGRVTEPRPDTRLAGRYVLHEQIGHGGMGRVFRARDTVLDRDVAVKVLEEADEDLAHACAREARAAARLAHPGIVKVFDSGHYDGCRFVVMEYVPGPTLRAILDRRRTLAPTEAITFAAKVADALDHAHGHGVVHCDVKPQNILLGPGGVPKLVDFGIARVATTTATLLNGEDERGSALYVAPEQVSGAPVDGRTDVYSLGVVLYEMLVGRPPFEGANVVALIMQRLVVDPPSLRALNPAVPPDVERVVLTALARESARRYASAADFRDAMRAVAGVAVAETGRPAPAAAITRSRARRGFDRLLGSIRPKVLFDRPFAADADSSRSRRLGEGWPRARPPFSGVRPRRGTGRVLAVAVLLGAVLATAVAGAHLTSTSPRHQVVVPTLVGKRLAEVPEILATAGVVAGPVRTRQVEGERAGTVVEQEPQPGQQVPPGGEVLFVVGTP